jgi:hypothetical protein
MTCDWVAQRKGGGLVGVAVGGPNDPFFGRPLWLQTPCCGHVLWGYDGRHLDALQGYVAADLRERTGPIMGMLDRLPAWIKKAGHRTEVLRAIDRLRDLLDRSAPEQRSDAAYERPEAPGPRPVRVLYFRRPY